VFPKSESGCRIIFEGGSGGGGYQVEVVLENTFWKNEEVTGGGRSIFD